MKTGKGATELNQQNKWIRMNYNMKGALERSEEDCLNVGMLQNSVFLDPV